MSVPHKIAKSLLPTEEHVNAFQRLCNKQIEEMRIHDAQMVNVKKDPENYHSYPPSIAHPDIMNSIVKNGNDYNIEFEIFDDETLEEKKAKLISSISKQAADLQEKIIPARKRNLTTIEANKISAIEVDKRTTTQKKQLEDFQNKFQQMSLINEHLANMEAQIDDLTEKDIEKWKPAPFQEVK